MILIIVIVIVNNTSVGLEDHFPRTSAAGASAALDPVVNIYHTRNCVCGIQISANAKSAASTGPEGRRGEIRVILVSCGVRRGLGAEGLSLNFDVIDRLATHGHYC